jgi:hypothetical protein
MSDNITGAADADTTRIDLGQRPYETPAPATSVGRNWTENHYAWIYVVGAVALLWGLGATFNR